MGNPSFEGQEGGESLNGWLSLSTDPFKSRRAQLSATGVIPGRVEDANPESTGYWSEIPGSR
jgi:hypothetical protein